MVRGFGGFALLALTVGAIVLAGEAAPARSFAAKSQDTAAGSQAQPVVMGARMVLVRGRIQHAPDGAGYVTHLVAETIEDRTTDLLLLSTPPLKPPRSPGDGATSASPDRGERPPEERVMHRHPRNVRVLPASRDFH